MNKLTEKQKSRLDKMQKAFNEAFYNDESLNIEKIQINKITCDLANKFSGKAYDDYMKLLEMHDHDNLFSNSFLEQIHKTLGSWNMLRSTFISSSDDFITALRTTETMDRINKLIKFKTDSFLKGDDDLYKIIEYFFSDIFNNSDNNSGKKIFKDKTTTRIVAISKLLHFFAPNLITPIDNQYTLKFFNITECSKKSIGEQNIFLQIHKIMAEFFNDYKNQTGDAKFFDDIIIGHELRKNEMITISHKMSCQDLENIIRANPDYKSTVNKIINQFIKENHE